jgi:adenosylmethionine-8-amino-7-oxononanoate aminotransferase
LEQLASVHPGIRNIRGAGLLRGFDLDHDVYGPTPGPTLEHACKERGLIARIGRDFVCLAPPLTTPEESLRRMLEIADGALHDLRQRL